MAERRVEKSAGDVERYILSTMPGDDGASQVVAVYDGSNNWKQNFVWNDEVGGIQVLEQADLLDYDTDGNTSEITRSFYHRNALGSVMEITDMNEAVVASYRYNPYGKVTIARGGSPQTTDPLGQHWAFAGMFNDEETGLLYPADRFYDPTLGRFVQADGFTGLPNVFEYAASRPSSAQADELLQGFESIEFAFILAVEPRPGGGVPDIETFGPAPAAAAVFFAKVEANQNCRKYTVSGKCRSGKKCGRRRCRKNGKEGKCEEKDVERTVRGRLRSKCKTWTTWYCINHCPVPAWPAFLGVLLATGFVAGRRRRRAPHQQR